MIGTLLVVIAGTTIGVGLTSVTECRGCAGVGVCSHTAVAATGIGGPGAVFETLLDTGVNVRQVALVGSRLVEHFHFHQTRSIGATEVIATLCTSLATHATRVGMTQRTVGVTAAGAKVGVEVVSTTKRRTMAAVIVGVVVVAITLMLVIVRQ